MKMPTIEMVLSLQPFRGRYEITITYSSISLRPLMPVTTIHCYGYFKQRLSDTPGQQPGLLLTEGRSVIMLPPLVTERIKDREKIVR